MASLTGELKLSEFRWQTVLSGKAGHINGLDNVSEREDGERATAWTETAEIGRVPFLYHFLLLPSRSRRNDSSSAYRDQISRCFVKHDSLFTVRNKTKSGLTSAA